MCIRDSWKGGPNTSKGAEYYWDVNQQSAGVLKESREAFLDEDKEKAAQLTRNNFNGLAAYEEKDETPFRFGSFTTMGELYVETGLNELRMSNYRRILSLDSAMVVVPVSYTHLDVYTRQIPYCAGAGNAGYKALI